ncbi:MAG: DUF805 domain-containing protein, partial [Anaerolineaceae bacterium]
YSVGVVAYELLAGQPPFVGDTMHSIIAQHMRDTPDLRQLPLEAREFVGRLLEKAPADRFSSSAVLGDSGVRDPDQTFHNRTVNRSRWETPNARVEDRAPKPLRNSTVLRPEQSEVAALERADDSKIRHGSILATLFSFQGRTGRATWAWVWVGWLAWFVVAALSSPIATELVVVFVGWSLVAVSTRRLHDLDKSGWWLLWVAAPGAVLVLLPMLALTRGNPVANRFGDLA